MAKYTSHRYVKDQNARTEIADFMTTQGPGRGGGSQNHKSNCCYDRPANNNAGLPPAVDGSQCFYGEKKGSASPDYGE